MPTILVTDQGRCVFNGKTELCTWTGFEFDYKAEQELTKVQCKANLSESTILGNPKGVISDDATTQDYELELKGKTGHFYNPEYFLFSSRPKDKTLLVINTTCSVGDKVIFEYRYMIYFPTTGR